MPSAAGSWISKNDSSFSILAIRRGMRYVPSMSITAIVQNDTIKLPVHVPDGTKVEVVLPRETSGGESEVSGSFFDTVRDLVGSVEGPADWAAEHDHYIHGIPKRGAK
jgi:hypothetical protein